MDNIHSVLSKFGLRSITAAHLSQELSQELQTNASVFTCLDTADAITALCELSLTLHLNYSQDDRHYLASELRAIYYDFESAYH